jgi:metal-responsive CopG/Arc/MetJ family transcriptional regulator
MKIAVSIPDPVFRAAESQAKRERQSRSHLYAEALREYLSRHAPDEVTESMDRALEKIHDPRDPFVAAAARSALGRNAW